MQISKKNVCQALDFREKQYSVARALSGFNIVRLFFMGCYVKSKVYEHRSKNMEALKKAIYIEIRRVPRQEMLKNVMRN